MLPELGAPKIKAPGKGHGTSKNIKYPHLKVGVFPSDKTHET